MKPFKKSHCLLVLVTLFSFGCDPNLTTNKPRAQAQNTVQRSAANPPPSKTPATVSPSPSPKPGASPSPLPKTSPSPSPISQGPSACPTGDPSYLQITGEEVISLMKDHSGSPFSTSSLSPSALTGLRLNSSEGLYFSLASDSSPGPSKDAAIGLIHCDPSGPNEPKIMAVAWESSSSSGINGGNDPTVSEDNSTSVNCPDASGVTLQALGEIQGMAAALQSISSARIQVVRVRSSQTESLYLALASGSNNQYLAALLQCGESAPSGFNLLGTTTSKSSGVTPID